VELSLDNNNDANSDGYWIEYLSKIEMEPDMMDEIWNEMKKGN